MQAQPTTEPKIGEMLKLPYPDNDPILDSLDFNHTLHIPVAHPHVQVYNHALALFFLWIVRLDPDVPLNCKLGVWVLLLPEDQLPGSLKRPSVLPFMGYHRRALEALVIINIVKFPPLQRKSNEENSTAK